MRRKDEKRIKEEKAAAREIANKLCGAFVWAHTRQGHKYWQRVHENLKKMAGDKELW
jgi:hypothetical protein